jgi:hypothetical protein
MGQSHKVDSLGFNQHYLFSADEVTAFINYMFLIFLAPVERVSYFDRTYLSVMQLKVGNGVPIRYCTL